MGHAGVTQLSWGSPCHRVSKSLAKIDSAQLDTDAQRSASSAGGAWLGRAEKETSFVILCLWPTLRHHNTFWCSVRALVGDWTSAFRWLGTMSSLEAGLSWKGLSFSR